MDDLQARLQALWLIVLIVMMVAVGILVILSILRSWRNYNIRQRKIEQGHDLRLNAAGAQPTDTDIDTWRESARRMKGAPDAAELEDDDLYESEADDPQESDEDEDEDDDAPEPPPFPRG